MTTLANWIERQVDAFNTTHPDAGVTTTKIELDLERAQRAQPLWKRAPGGVMNTVIEPPKRKRKKGTRAAKRDAAARGISWSALSKSQRSYLRLLARTEAGSKGAFKKLCKQLGVEPPSASTPAVPAATTSPDSTLAKIVLPGQPDLAAATSALAAVKEAIANAMPGVGGWRRR